MYLFLIGIFALASQAASVDRAVGETYKSYKDFRVFSVTGDRDALVDLATYLNEYDVSVHSFFLM